MTRPNTIRQVIKLAAFFDREGKERAPIQTHVTRGYLLRYFEAVRRGGPIFVGGHEVKHKCATSA